jgi:hypothetical protein
MPGNPLSDPNWAPNLADTVERVVGQVRDKTTKPLLTAYRGLVFGLVAMFGAAFAVVLLVVVGVRGLQALIEIGTSHADAVWISYFAIGVVFAVAGLVLMKKRFPEQDPS